MEEVLAGLTNRVFILNNVHEDGTEIFQTRWAMSYLRGPLTRTQIKTLTDARKASAMVAQAAVEKRPTSAISSTEPVTGRAVPAAAARAPAPLQRPVIPSEIPQFFIPLRSNVSGTTLIYHPMLLGMAEVRFTDGKSLDVTKNISLLTSLTDNPVPVDWEQGQSVALAIDDLERVPEDGARFMELASIATRAKSYDSWSKDFASWVYRNHRLELLESPTLKVVSTPAESERDFRVRLQQLARERRDQAIEKLRQRYAPKLASLEEKRRRAEQAVERETEQSKSQKIQTAISFGATLLSSFMGRKKVSIATLGRATTAARGVNRSMKEAEDVTRVQETLAAVSEQLSELESQFQAETQALEKSIDPQTEQFERISLKPTKANIAVKLVTLAWAPYLTDEQGSTRPAWQ
jgi:hypothetical protein